MTAYQFGGLLGDLARILSPVIALALLVLLGWSYYLIFSALRNVKLIRLQFERLNDNLEARRIAGL